MGTTRLDPLRAAYALAKRVSAGVAPSPALPLSDGDDDAVSVDNVVVTVDFRRAARLRLPQQPPAYGAKVLAFTRPQAVMLAHPSAAR